MAPKCLKSLKSEENEVKINVELKTNAFRLDNVKMAIVSFNRSQHKEKAIRLYNEDNTGLCEESPLLFKTCVNPFNHII